MERAVDPHRKRSRADGCWARGPFSSFSWRGARSCSFALPRRHRPSRWRPPVPPSPPPPVVGTLGKRRTLQEVLAALGVAKDRAIHIVQAMRPHIDFRKLKPQDQLELHHDASGDAVKLVYRQSPIDVVEATRAGDEWAAARVDVPVDRKVVVVAGTLKDNLFESIERLENGPSSSSTLPRSSPGISTLLPTLNAAIGSGWSWRRCPRTSGSSSTVASWQQSTRARADSTPESISRTRAGADTTRWPANRSGGRS